MIASTKSGSVAATRVRYREILAHEGNWHEHHVVRVEQAAGIEVDVRLGGVPGGRRITHPVRQRRALEFGGRAQVDAGVERLFVLDLRLQVDFGIVEDRVQHAVDLLEVVVVVVEGDRVLDGQRLLAVDAGAEQQPRGRRQLPLEGAGERQRVALLILNFVGVLLECDGIQGKEPRRHVVEAAAGVVELVEHEIVVHGVAGGVDKRRQIRQVRGGRVEFEIADPALPRGYGDAIREVLAEPVEGQPAPIAPSVGELSVAALEGGAGTVVAVVQGLSGHEIHRSSDTFARVLRQQRLDDPDDPELRPARSSVVMPSSGTRATLLSGRRLAWSAERTSTIRSS